MLPDLLVALSCHLLSSVIVQFHFCYFQRKRRSEKVSQKNNFEKEKKKIRDGHFLPCHRINEV